MVKQWHGTSQELLQLREAVARNCTCSPPARADCPPHTMLSSQTVLDHLLYVYRAREIFMRAERCTGA
jgi:hypothetical protein